jgi:acyl carrier protein
LTIREKILEIRDRIRDFLRTEMNKDVAAVTDTESLLEAGILDSMGVVQLVGFIERDYGVPVSDDDMVPENFDSIVAVEAFINRSRRAHG